MKVIALTGPPAAGKSTIVDLFDDMGVPAIDTGDAVRRVANEQLDDPSEEEIWSWVSDQREQIGDEAPTMMAVSEQIDSFDSEVIVVSGLREQAEVEWLESYVGKTLVVRIDADRHDRMVRYADREMDSEGVVSSETEIKIKRELLERENQEMPYPDHAVTIWNSDRVKIDDLWSKIENLVAVMECE